VAAHDLFPSIVGALNLNGAAELKLDGSNQWPALSSGKTLPRPAFLIASHDIACFNGDWKIIETSDGKRALYNLAKDISEEKDVAAEQPDIMKALGAKLDELKKGLPEAAERRVGPGAGGGKGPGAGGFGKGPPGKGKGLPK
jgi:hypothetical protein